MKKKGVLICAFFIIGASILFCSKNIRLLAQELVRRFTIYMVLEDADVEEVKEELRRIKFVKEFFFVSKEDALKELSALLRTKELKEVLGYNPLPSGFVIKLKNLSFNMNPRLLVQELSNIKGTKLFFDKESLFFLFLFFQSLSFFLYFLYGVISALFFLLIRRTEKLTFFKEFLCLLMGFFICALFYKLFFPLLGTLEWIQAKSLLLLKEELCFVFLTAASLMLFSRFKK